MDFSPSFLKEHYPDFAICLLFLIISLWRLASREQWTTISVARQLIVDDNWCLEAVNVKVNQVYAGASETHILIVFLFL